jgi:hypothetical protein
MMDNIISQHLESLRAEAFGTPDAQESARFTTGERQFLLSVCMTALSLAMQTVGKKSFKERLALAIDARNGERKAIARVAELEKRVAELEARLGRTMELPA